MLIDAWDENSKVPVHINRLFGGYCVPGYTNN